MSLEPVPPPEAAEPSWERVLVDRQPVGSLVAVAREGRLTRETRLGPVRVDVTLVDEAVLALVEAATRRRRNITFVYPSPAGEVSVLLAAQILVQKLLRHERSPSVGVITRDPSTAMRTWNQLGIASPGARANLAAVFPCYRARPDGESPFGQTKFQGVLFGSRFRKWPVDVVIVDTLMGPVEAIPAVPTVRLFADPTDPQLEKLALAVELIWGWCQSDIAALDAATSSPSRHSVPFSVSSERLHAIGRGLTVTIHVVPHPSASRLISRLRDDLRTLAQVAGSSPSPSIARAIRIIWHHLSTLAALPCRPSEFDRFAGIPPIAARPTKTFGAEIAAWARTLDPDLRELADIVATDLEDLRTALQEAAPFDRLLADLLHPGAVVVVKTHTAARALEQSLRDRASIPSQVQIVAIRRLHTHGSYNSAIVVGTPAPWDWHRLDSGIARHLHVATLSEVDARSGCRTLTALSTARQRWADIANRARVWRELVGGEPPSRQALKNAEPQVSVVSERPVEAVRDPFAAFEPFFVSVPLFVGEEGPEESVAEQVGEPGSWQGAVEAVEVATDIGVIVLPRARFVDVRVDKDIREYRAEDLKPGMYILVDRRGGRLGLLEAVADRLKHQRPDLLAANLIISDLRTAVQDAFAKSRMTRLQLFQKLRSLGFEKTYASARSYVDPQGPLAPRDFPDLERLNRALELGLPNHRLKESFAGVMRWRTFRRAIGKALVAASHDSAAPGHFPHVDPDTGLSSADLRELVLEAKVLQVTDCPNLVPIGETGRFKDR